MYIIIARLFEVNDENLAYIYADKHLRNEVGDKLPVLEDEPDEKTQDPFILLKQWKLEQYGKVLIDDEGYDDVQFWKDISEQELKNMKWKNGHIKKFMKLASQL